MSAEKYEKWLIDESFVLQSPDLQSISFESGGLTIRINSMRDRNKVLEVHFEDAPLAFRVANESFRCLSLKNLFEFDKGPFYIIRNSEFLSWMNKESLDIYKDDPLFHLAIATEEWIDVICCSLPTLKLKILGAE